MWDYRKRFVNIVIMAACTLNACSQTTSPVVPTKVITGIPISTNSAPVITTPSRPSVDQDQVAQLAAIVKMRGHLMASYNLWNTKSFEDAYTHTNEHILDELFYAVRSPLKSKNADLELQDKLLTYSKSANKSSTSVNFEKNYKQALAALNESYILLANDRLNDLRTQAAVVRDVLDTATSEYDEAVNNDKVTNAEEWQDTVGFLNATRDLYITSVEPALKEIAPDKTSAISTQFTTLSNNFASYSKFPTKIISSDQFSKQIDELMQNITQAANLPAAPRTAKLLIKTQHDVDQSLNYYRTGMPDLAYETIIKCQINGLEKIKGDIANRDPNLMTAFDAQFNTLIESIKTRAALTKVETDATALTEYIEKALKIAAPSRRPGSKH